MITIGDTTFDLSDPLVLAACIAGAVLLLMLIMLMLTLRRAGRSADAVHT